MNNATAALTDADGMIQIAGASGSQNHQWTVIVDVVLLTLTVLGASAILVNMFYNERVLHRAATVRMRLVQALVVSDLLLGVSAIVPSAVKLTGGGIAHGSSFCDGFGFLLVAAVWGEHCWTLVLAVATYMILCHPLHSVTRLLDKRWIWLYLAVWSICVAVAVIGYELYGYWPSGGICYYGANAGLYAQLIQFIPRGFVFLCVIVIYSKLNMFLKRPDRIKGSFSKSQGHTLDRTGHTSSGEYEIGGVAMHGDELGKVVSRREGRGSGKSKLPSREKLLAGFRRFSFAASPKTQYEEDEKGFGQMGTEMGKLGRGGQPWAKGEAGEETSGDVTPPESDVTAMSNPNPLTEAIPPWERLELPAFQIGGQRYGGSPANLRDQQSNFLGWKGMGKSSKALGSRSPRSSMGAVSSDIGTHSRAPSLGSSRTALPGVGARRDRRRANDVGGTNSLSGRGSVSSSPLIGLSTRPTALSLDNSAVRPSNGLASIPGSPKHLDATFEEQPAATLDEDRPIQSRRVPVPITVTHNSRLSTMTPGPPPDATDTIPLVYPSDSLPALSASGSQSTYNTGSIPSVADTLFFGSKDIHIRRDSTATGSEIDYARRGSGPVTFILPLSKVSVSGLASEYRRGSVPSTSARSSIDALTISVPEKSRPIDIEAQRHGKAVDGEAEDDDDEEMDLARMLADSYEEHYQPNDHGRRRTSDESEDWQQESMASYLNRKTALLMLYFPLAYVVLFSASLVRLIYDFSTTAKEPVALTVISRWLIFAQGLVDATIYGGIEWKTKRAVRRKIRRTTGGSGSVGAGVLGGSWGGGGGGATAGDAGNNSRMGSRGSIGAAEMFKVSLGAVSSGFRRKEATGTGTASRIGTASNSPNVQDEVDDAAFRGNGNGGVS